MFMACITTTNNNLNNNILNNNIIINMYNRHHHHQNNNPENPKNTFNNPPMISPRISFSHDFAPPVIKPSRDYNTPPVSSDFEFSVSNNNMMPADELFFKGRLLPFKDVTGSGSAVGQKTTLRDELLAGDNDDGNAGVGGVSSRPPKAASARWKGFLGLRKSHIGSKRADKSDGSRSGSGSGSGQDDNGHVSKASQEMMSQGGGSSHFRDTEFRMQ